MSLPSLRTVCIVDTETTGLDPSNDVLLEVAAAVWSVEHRAMVSCASWLVDTGTRENPAEAINGIPAGILALGVPVAQMERELSVMLGASDAVLAHNAAFDRAWFSPPMQAARPWICTCDDVEWPRPSSRSLVAIALAHGVGVVHAHRALSDVMTLVRLLERAAELTDVHALLQRGLRPKAKFKAVVSYERREEAKLAGFRWDASSRGWYRTMAYEDVAALPFPCEPQ